MFVDTKNISKFMLIYFATGERRTFTTNIFYGFTRDNHTRIQVL
jgi:hypothetical protein